MTVFLNIVPPSDHVCYILQSTVVNKIYVGYTINVTHRLRQHNGEIVGGAKKTKYGRPWRIICVIKGFFEVSAALRFEYRMQHGNRKKNDLLAVLKHLQNLIVSGDGSVARDNKLAWPFLAIDWYIPSFNIVLPRVYNNHYHCYYK